MARREFGQSRTRCGRNEEHVTLPDIRGRSHRLHLHVVSVHRSGGEPNESPGDRAVVKDADDKLVAFAKPRRRPLPAVAAVQAEPSASSHSATISPPAVLVRPVLPKSTGTSRNGEGPGTTLGTPKVFVIKA